MLALTAAGPGEGGVAGAAGPTDAAPSWQHAVPSGLTGRVVGRVGAGSVVPPPTAEADAARGAEGGGDLLPSSFSARAAAEAAGAPIHSHSNGGGHGGSGVAAGDGSGRWPSPSGRVVPPPPEPSVGDARLGWLDEDAHRAQARATQNRWRAPAWSDRHATHDIFAAPPGEGEGTESHAHRHQQHQQHGEEEEVEEVEGWGVSSQPYDRPDVAVRPPTASAGATPPNAEQRANEARRRARSRVLAPWLDSLGVGVGDADVFLVRGPCAVWGTRRLPLTLLCDLLCVCDYCIN